MAGKKLTFTQIKNEDKKYEVKERVEFHDGSFTHIFPNFRPSKIQKMLMELLMDYPKAREAELEIESYKTVDWLMFNIIKHFSELPISDEIFAKNEQFMFLIDSDYYEKLSGSFPQESIDKVTKQIKNMGVALQNLNTLSDEEREQAAKQLTDNAE